MLAQDVDEDAGIEAGADVGDAEAEVDLGGGDHQLDALGALNAGSAAKLGLPKPQHKPGQSHPVQ